MELNSRLLVIAVILSAMHFQIAHLQRDNIQGQKYCGSQIGKALSTICKGNYNTLKRMDRFPRPAQWDGMYGDMPMPDENPELGFPYQSKEEASTLMGGKRRKKRWGVYNECCEKSCTVEELSSYCAADGKRR
uniref:LIRP n=1 Tax=Diabrotica virgifera virgifera TaxID=50390 RepID=A0A6P7H066_DIAVI